jgi:L-iditol 2-dehydrogenase
MKAAVLYGREDVRIERVDVPRLEPGDVLLRTRVALTCGTDVKVYRRGYHARMIVPPAVFGHEVAGVVEAVGDGVEDLEPGTAVMAANSAPCGECHYCRHDSPSLCDDLLFWNGAYAEFARIPARVVRKNLLPLTDGVAFREAAMVEPLACVVRGVEESWIGRGQSVAVIGAGPIGLMFAALARMRGAHVVVAGRTRERLDKALEIGAEAVVTARDGEDVAARLRALSPEGRGADVVIEAVGQPETSEAAVRAVRKGGVVNLFGGCPADTKYEDRHRLTGAALPGADDQVHVPPHAGQRAQGVSADRRRPLRSERLHHRGSAARRAAGRPGSAGARRQRPEDRDPALGGRRLVGGDPREPQKGRGAPCRAPPRSSAESRC